MVFERTGIKSLVFPVPIIVADVDIPVGDKALGGEKVMRFIARERLGR